MPSSPWYSDISPDAWRALAAKLGWMLDAMDFLLYVMAIGQLRAYFGFDSATAGLLGTITLLVSAAGGLLFGLVADRFGRTRALMATILIFSFSSLGAATSQTFVQLMLWRALLGFGMGGEWAIRCGAGERDLAGRASHQGDQHHAVRLGDRLYPRRDACSADPGCPCSGRRHGAGCSSSVCCRRFLRYGSGPRSGAGGVAQARKRRRDRGKSRSRVLFGRELWLRTIAGHPPRSSVQFAYWGLFFWLPSFLARPSSAAAPA